MNNTRSLRITIASHLFLLLALLLAFGHPAKAGPVSCGCYCGKVLRPPCSDSACKSACGYQEPSTSPNTYSPSPSYDYEAERRRQEAEAEQRRQEEARRKQEEAERQAQFEREKLEAAATLKGISGNDSPSLKGLSGTNDYGLKGAESRVGRELKAIEGDSREASDAASRDDLTGASGRARGGFDTGASRDRGTLVIPNISGKKPATPSALANKIDPRAMKDPQMQKEIQQSLAWYEQLEKVKNETNTKLADVQKQLKSGTGDKAALKAYEQQLTSQKKDTETQQGKTEQDLKKKLVNRGFDWNESGTTAAGDQSGAKR